jgi:16S rRNA (cytidine1402-2'-O)-methyltransferase
VAGILYLIPTPLGDSGDPPLPRSAGRNPAHRRRTDHLRRRTSQNRARLPEATADATPIQQLTLLELNEHTPTSELDNLIAPLLAGSDVGLISEAGCPAVADPGANLVRLAHRHGIRVRPLTGPSSILLALMGSGLVGQRFAFHGYLPAKPDERAKALRELEKRARKRMPRRCSSKRRIAIRPCWTPFWPPASRYPADLACDLTLDSEFLVTRPVSGWRKHPPDIQKRPTVFLLYAQSLAIPRQNVSRNRK